MITAITSLQNPKVKLVVALREKRKRDQTGLTVIEGYDELALALAAAAPLADLFFCPALIRPEQRALLEQVGAGSGQVGRYEVSEAVFMKMAYREHPDGWLATCALPRRALADLRLNPNPLLVILESVEKPGNLGAILRTAEAAGVDGLILCDPRTDWGNPNVIRASKGTLFGMQTASAGNAETLDWLRARGIRAVVGTPDAALPYTRFDWRGPCALVVGTENEGVSPFWQREADAAVSIPMFGRVNSLNVATAAALLIYEAVRQRGE